MPAKRYDAEKVDASPLGQDLHFAFSGKTAQNRFLKAAMTERQSSWDAHALEKRGVPSPELINLYRRWGEGEFGVILTGNTMVDLEQLEAAGNPIVPPDAAFEGERFDAFRKMAAASKAHGALIVSQLSHPGRQCPDAISKNVVSASDVQLEGNHVGHTYAKPHAATASEIKSIVDAFAHAAEFLHKAGYDGVELHGAHGYLLSQFLSPTTNLRTDKYGGSLENRSRIVFEIAQAIRQRVPTRSFILGIKVNSVEFQNKGFDTEEARELCRNLEANEFDFVELSGGTYEELAFAHKRESTKKREAFFLDFAETITPALSKTRTYVTGGLKTVPAMVKALKSVDGVGLARPVCQEPVLPRDILAGKVNAAVEQKLDQNDFGLTNVAAGTQIKQIGRDQEPVDLSNDENKENFMKDMGEWFQKMGADETGSTYGYVDLHTHAVPYSGNTL